MSIREHLKKISFIKELYLFALYLKNAVTGLLRRLYIVAARPQEARLLRQMRQAVRAFYPARLHFENHEQYIYGKNVLGYPALAQISQDGKYVGWGNNRLVTDGASLPFLQVKTDEEINFPNIFNHYRPVYILDFGTAAGGSAVFFHRLASVYANPKILSIDISDKAFVANQAFHQKNRTQDKVRFIFHKSSLDCVPEVTEFLRPRQPGERALISFDDHHTYEHTYQELVIYSPLLQSGDVIIMQDTWDQDFFGLETSPLLAVYRFLKEHPEFRLAEQIARELVLPSNFIYGVIEKF